MNGEGIAAYRGHRWWLNGDVSETNQCRCIAEALLSERFLRRLVPISELRRHPWGDSEGHRIWLAIQDDIREERDLKRMMGMA